jgi:hypothetical protein
MMVVDGRLEEKSIARKHLPIRKPDGKASEVIYYRWFTL